ncbi:galactarate dehydratase [Raoultella terrigena]|uniref:Galactarate dehydratase n=1 Tax=Raoultella terrigena TaxID=577 RepID=A0A4U9D2H0_RAOTE|nr:galactarate dehydratase [Raoultella terrigena]
MQYIKIHSQDNVAVALADMAAGTTVTIDDAVVTLGQDIVRGHKFALCGIAKGKNVIKYGFAHWSCAGGYRARGAYSRPQYADQPERP